MSVISPLLRAVNRRLPRSVSSLLTKAYHVLLGLNYRYRIHPTPCDVCDTAFSTYELLDYPPDPFLEMVLDSVGEDEVFFDVGANIGVYTLAVATTVPTAEIVAFEPNSTAFERLTANVELNQVNAERVQLYQVALSDTTGRRTFYNTIPSGRSSFNETLASGHRVLVTSTELVDVTPLDTLMETESLPPPDHLKIDGEGHGFAVLSGAEHTIREHRPTIYFEPHGKELLDLDAEVQIEQFAAAFGYSVTELEDPYCFVLSPD